MDKVIFNCKLSQDPELRFTSSGTPTTTFPVYVRTRDGGIRYDRVTAFGRLAESACEHLSKGDAITVEGAPHFDKDTHNPIMFDSKSGKKCVYDTTATALHFVQVAKWGGDFAPATDEYEDPF